jgi:DNA helicase-2/ATP-dependent DNA helicase PcrA
MRVANILKTTDTDPSSILCLTFTNAAASNMRDRLLRLAGPETRTVTVKTFHSFAVEIINLYPEYFWNGARLTTVPDAVQLEIIGDILAALPLDNPLALKFAGRFTGLGDVQQALKLAKEAGLTPEKLHSLIRANLAYLDIIEPELIQATEPRLSAKQLPLLQQAVEALPDQPIDELAQPLISLSTLLKESLAGAIAQDQITGKTTRTGAWKRRFVQSVAGEKGMYDERRRNAWWLALADVYTTYRDRLHIRGHYDYADMLVEVIAQLEQNPELLAAVQERFLYLLIDEFQDTNAAQMRLAHLTAANPTSGDRPNLMAVGDDDQSIFKFNGAELGNMLAFQRTYPAAQTIVLAENYRSSQAVLDTASKIINQAADRLVKRDPSLQKNLRAANEPKATGTIRLVQLPTREHQYSHVTTQIKKLHHRGDDIAVLARGHESLRNLAAMLLDQGVPVRYERQSNILEHEAVGQILLLAETVHASQTGDTATVSHNLSLLLRHPMWQIRPSVLWQLAIAGRAGTNWLDILLEHTDETLNNIGHWLLWLASESAYQPLQVMMEYLLGLRETPHYTSPVRTHFMAQRAVSQDYLQTLSALRLLRQTAKDFTLDGSSTLADFVRFIAIAQENGQIIADQSPFVSQPHAVQLMTVHKAKGLEFDTVFIIDAVEDAWKPRTAGRKPPANLPLQPHGEDYDDYVRLMYVAATRARHSIVATAFGSDGQGGEVLPSPLIHSALIPEVIPTEEAGDPIEVLETAARWPRLESTNERALLAGKLENFSLSATSLLNFLDVSRGGPQYFLERNLLHLPEVKTVHMAFGTALHRALETAQNLTNRDQFTEAATLSAYEQALRAEQLPTTDLEHYLQHGQNVIRRLLAYDTFALPKGSRPELELRDVRLGPARLRGTLDRVDITGDQLTIVDYKTGNPLSSFTTRDQTKAIKAWRHRTQLIFYALLAKHSGRYPNKSITGQMWYAEAETPQSLICPYTPTPEDLTHLEQLVTAVCHHITTYTLPDVSSYSPDYKGIQAFQEDLLQ